MSNLRLTTRLSNNHSPQEAIHQKVAGQRKSSQGLKKPGFKLIIKVLVSISILAYIFWKIPLTDVLHSIKMADPSLIVASLLLFPVIFILNASHTKILTNKQAMPISLTQILEINLIAVFYSLFLPGVLSGGVIKWHKFSQPQGKGSEAFAVILFNRFYDTIILCVLGTAFCLADTVARQNFFMVTTIILTCLGLGICGLIGHTPRAIDYVQQKLLQLPLRAEAVRRIINKLSEAMKQFHNLTRNEFLKITATIVTKHLIGIFTFLLFALAVQIDLSYIALGWIRTSIMIAMMLPISLGGLGIREGGLILMLQMYGVAPQQALVFSFLLLGRNLIAGLIGGLLEARRMIGGGHA